MASYISLGIGLVIGLFVATGTRTGTAICTAFFTLGMPYDTAQAMALTVIVAACIILCQLLLFAMQRTHQKVQSAEDEAERAERKSSP